MLVARTELRRTVRAVIAERTKLLVLGLVGLFVYGSMVVAGGYLLPRLGAEVSAGTTAEEVELATGFATGITAVAWIFLVFMAAIRAFTAAADPDEPAFLLTSTSVRSAVVGIVAAEVVLFSAWILPPALVLSGAFAVGAGSVLPVLAAVPFVALALISAVPIGFVVGLWARHLLTVYEPIARYRTPLFVGFWAAYFGALATGYVDPVVGRLFATLQDSPLGWPGHVLLAAVPNVPASSLTILGAVGAASAAGAAAVAVAIPSAERHWFAEPARFEGTDRPASESAGRLEALLARVCSRPVRTVTVTAIRRTRRAPIRLAYAGYPLFGAIVFAQEIVQTGTVPTHAAVALSLYVVWAAGALFTLNPLGDLGRALPAVVASPLSGRQAIAGLVLAGAIVAAPVALLASLALGVASPLSAGESARLVAVTTVGGVVTPALATGIGAAAPRFGSVNVTNNREAVMPSKTAFAVYSAAVVLPSIAALVLYVDAPALVADAIVTVSTVVPGPEVSVSARGVAIVAWTVLGVGLLAPVVSVLYAIERFDWYTLE